MQQLKNKLTSQDECIYRHQAVDSLPIAIQILKKEKKKWPRLLKQNTCLLFKGELRLTLSLLIMD